MPVDQPLLCVQLLEQSHSCVKLDVTPVRKRPQKKNLNLPFGLQATRIKRAKRSAGPSSSNLHDANSSIYQELVFGKRPGPAVDVGVSPPPVSSSSSDPDNSSSQSDDSSESDSSECDSEGEILAFDGNHREEENATRAILRDHASIQDDPVPQPDDPNLNPNRLNPAPAAPAAPARVAVARTACQPFVGVADVGVQVHAKLAQCRFCQKKIERQSTRIAYSFSKTKFHAWLHVSCFRDYLQQEGGSFHQARSFISRWLEDHNDCSSTMRSELEDLVESLHSSE